MNNLKKYYEKNYKKFGFKFQREYPNEELVRFISRNFNKLRLHEKRKIKILETGCGSGGNLWMLAEQGFDSFGIDLSKSSIRLAKMNLRKKKLQANLVQGDMVNLPYKNNFFQAGNQNGNIFKNGLNMFLYQAQKAFYIWHKIEPIVDEEVINFLKNSSSEIKK